MADRTPLRGTFFAFQKRDGALLLPAAITFIVGMVVLIVVWVLGIAALVGGFANAVAAQADPATAASRALLIFPLYVVFLFAIFLWGAAFEAGCLRWMIRGEREGLFGFSFGADTWRVYSGYWLWLVFFIVGYILTAVLFFIFIAIGAGFAATARDLPPAVGVAGVVVAVIACLVLPIWLGVRTAPAAATSIVRRKFAFFDSWKASKGRFWSLFGSFFVLWLIYFIVIAALWIPIMGPMFTAGFQAGFQHPGDSAASSEAMRAAMHDRFENTSFVVLYFGLQLVGIFLATWFYVLLYGVNARAVLVAVEEGKIEGVTPGVAKAFE
ncbi:MAG: hypothetical protein ABUL42_04010 [Terricaulis silvestris]